jgi:hypothetical protein
LCSIFMLQVLYKPGMAHAGILVNTAWQATAIQAFLQVTKRPGGSQAAAAAVAAAEAPAGTAEDVVAAAEQQQQQQEQNRGGSSCDVGSTAATTLQQQQGQCSKDISTACELQEQQRQGGSIAASSSDADVSSIDTDDTAWESLHMPTDFRSAGRLHKCSERRKVSQPCSSFSCNCLNCQLFALAVPERSSSSSNEDDGSSRGSSSSSSDDLAPDAVKSCSDAANLAVAAVCRGHADAIVCVANHAQQQQQQ